MAHWDHERNAPAFNAGQKETRNRAAAAVVCGLRRASPVSRQIKCPSSFPFRGTLFCFALPFPLYSYHQQNEKPRSESLTSVTHRPRFCLVPSTARPSHCPSPTTFRGLSPAGLGSRNLTVEEPSGRRIARGRAWNKPSSHTRIQSPGISLPKSLHPHHSPLISHLTPRLTRSLSGGTPGRDWAQALQPPLSASSSSSHFTHTRRR